MNSGAKIGIGVAIPILIIVAVFAMNAYAISNLQFRGHSVGDVDLVDMSMDTKFEICNPFFFPASFETLKVNVDYKSTNFGTFTIWGKTIPSNTPTVVDGRINMNGQAIMQLFVAALGSAFGGENMDLDPKQIKYNTELDAPILGIIPFSISKSYASNEFMEIFQGSSNDWSCGGTTPNSLIDDMPFMSGLQQSSHEESDTSNGIITPDDVSEMGQLGSEHSHAAILVKIFGDEFDFSAPAYQIKSSWIHFEGRDGSTIHKHSTGVTLGYLFETLGIGLDDQCYVFQDGRSFCTNEDYALRFFINGDKVSDIRDYEVMDGDRILISYGAENQNEIMSQLNELSHQLIIK